MPSAINAPIAHAEAQYSLPGGQPAGKSGSQVLVMVTTPFMESIGNIVAAVIVLLMLFGISKGRR